MEFELAHLIFVDFHTPQSLLHIAVTLKIFQIGPGVHQIQTLSHLHFRILTLKLLIFGIGILLDGSSEFLAHIFPLADLRCSIFLVLLLWSTKFVVVHFLVHCVVERIVDLSMVIVRRIRVVSLSRKQQHIACLKQCLILLHLLPVFAIHALHEVVLAAGLCFFISLLS